MARILRIFDETNNLNLIRLRDVEPKSFADRIAFGKVFSSESLIHHCDFRRAQIVLRCEGTPEQQGDFHDFKKVFPHVVKIDFARLRNRAVGPRLCAWPIKSAAR